MAKSLLLYVQPQVAYCFKASSVSDRSESLYLLHSSNYTVLTAPSAPSFISFSEVTSSTLNVSWGFPLSPNGVVEGYRVVYEPTAPIQGQSVVELHN